MSPLLPKKPIGRNYYDESHPNSKRLLDDNVFWLIGDEDGPICGDTGSDALALFWSWRDQNPNQYVLSFLFEMLRNWGFQTDDLGIIASGKVELAIDKLHVTTNTFDDATLAVAFAQFMKDGCIDKDLYQLTERVLERQSDARVISYRCECPTSRLDGLSKAKDAFKKFPFCQNT